jgi:hypothetical protein
MVMDRGLQPGEAEVAGIAVHYAFGAAVGALYGAALDGIRRALRRVL